VCTQPLDITSTGVLLFKLVPDERRKDCLERLTPAFLEHLCGNPGYVLVDHFGYWLML